MNYSKDMSARTFRMNNTLWLRFKNAVYKMKKITKKNMQDEVNEAILDRTKYLEKEHVKTL